MGKRPQATDEGRKAASSTRKQPTEEETTDGDGKLPAGRAHTGVAMRRRKGGSRMGGRGGPALVVEDQIQRPRGRRCW
jgi:hypothetical protein